MKKIKDYQTVPLKTGISVVAVMVSLAAFGSYAESYFNTQFLNKDGSDVADIKNFIDTGASVPPGVYTVDVYFNETFISSEDINFINPDKTLKADESSGLLPCLNKSWLDRLGILFNQETVKQDIDAGNCLFITQFIPTASTEFDVAKLRLNISVPQAFLKSTGKGYIPPELWDEGVDALLFNYNFSGDSGTYGNSSFFSLMSGANVGPWRLRNNGSWSNNSGSKEKARWENINTYLERNIVPLKSQFVAGDTNSGNEVFDSNAFRGVRLYSSSSMFPDSMQGYAPTVRGVARTNAKVMIRQNGYTVYQTYVPPGPFELTDINPQMSNGNLEITIEESDGTTQFYVQPYSTVPVLQREGRFKYDVLMGRYRSGIEDQDNPFYSQATLMYGLPRGYTLYGGTQLSSRFKSLAAGVGVNIGRWGATSLDLTHSDAQLSDGSRKTGQSLRFLYAKSLEPFGTTVRLLGYRYSTRGFYTLSDSTYRKMSGYDYDSVIGGDEDGKDVPLGYYNLHNTRKGNIQVNINQRLGDYGSVYLTGAEQSYWNTSVKDRYYQAGYTSGWKGISYTLALSYNQYRDMSASDRMVSFNVSVPLSLFSAGNSYRLRPIDSMFATFSASERSGRGTSWNAGLSGTALEDRNLSYALRQGYRETGGASGGLNANYRGTYGSAAMGYNYSEDYRSLNYGMSGGVIIHRDGITLGQPLGTTNVLVKAKGASGARVENQTGVRTDWRGYTYMPYATAYRNNRVALDLGSLDDHTDIQDNVRNVVPTKGAVVRADYEAYRGYRALFTLRKSNGSYVPFGSMVTEEGGRSSGIASESGEVYLNGMGEQGKLKVKWGAGPSEQCSVSYQLSPQEVQKSIVRRELSCSK